MLIYFSIALLIATIMLTTMYATENKHPFDPLDSLFLSCVVGIIWPASMIIGTCWFVGRWIRKNYLSGDSDG